MKITQAYHEEKKWRGRGYAVKKIYPHYNSWPNEASSLWPISAETFLAHYSMYMMFHTKQSCACHQEHRTLVKGEETQGRGETIGYWQLSIGLALRACFQGVFPKDRLGHTQKASNIDTGPRIKSLVLAITFKVFSSQEVWEDEKGDQNNGNQTTLWVDVLWFAPSNSRR